MNKFDTSSPRPPSVILTHGACTVVLVKIIGMFTIFFVFFRLLLFHV